ncbi:MAG: hypothetical protein QMB93_04010 [Schleiferiaceae bacterium]|mgnify:FL=1|jgi:hypothetical protein|tara:strand:- start:4069 stop:4281 length:213 start_codon:yes stop_codon:yes gene_type:complete
MNLSDLLHSSIEELQLEENSSFPVQDYVQEIDPADIDQKDVRTIPEIHSRGKHALPFASKIAGSTTFSVF